MSPATDGATSRHNHSAQARAVPENVKLQAYVAAGLAVLLVLELAGIGFYAYHRVRTALQPEKLADRVEQLVREHYPEVRKDVVVQVRRKAPEVAEQVSQKMLEAVPDARADLERIAARELAAGLDSATELSADEFSELLERNHAKLVKVFQTIEDAPEEADRLVRETESEVESQLGVDIQRQARAALRTLAEFNDKLARLAGPPGELSDKEQLERRIARVLKTMEQADGDDRISARSQLRR